MNPQNLQQQREMLLEYVSALNSLELVKLIHTRQTSNALRSAAQRIQTRLKYDVVYEAMSRLAQDMKNPSDRLDYYWQIVNKSGGVQNVLSFERKAVELN